jgi:uncharacterized membrane protein SpoIIM required for sporulation
MLGFLLKRFLMQRLRLPLFPAFFLLGLFFALFGMILAVLTHVWLLAVFVVAISILPFLSRAVSVREILSEKWESTRSFYSQLLGDYTAFFLGVFFAFLVFGVMGGIDFVVSFVGFTVSPLETVQSASFVDFVGSVLVNNVGVFLLAFLLSLLFELGVSLVVSWNAVFWGLLMAVRIFQAHAASSSPLFSLFFMFSLLPHLIMEAVSYIAAAYAGLLLSRLVIREKELRWGFEEIVGQSTKLVGAGLLLLFCAAVIEGVVFLYVIPH